MALPIAHFVLFDNAVVDDVMHPWKLESCGYVVAVRPEAEIELNDT